MTEWKPGDVALIRVGTGDWEYGIRTEFGRWACRHGENYADTVQVAPLAAIDPEDRHQCEDLADALTGVGVRNAGWDLVRGALREFVNPAPPLKPKQPTGWLAAVEDRSGNRWCIVGGPTRPGSEWYSPDLNARRSYADIAVVRVLSEGVTQ